MAQRKSRFTGATRKSSPPQPQTQAPPQRNYSSTPQQQAPHQSHTTPQPTAQPQMASSGGMGSGLVSNIAGAVVGNMIGHAIYDSFTGGSKDSSEQPQYSQQEMQKCFSQMQAFSQCLEQSSNNISSCQYAFDTLNECKRGLQQNYQPTNQNSEW
ncbi:predicted protein [Naegleria gruberi]|uniref:Predicted protein n=1 Tax=Naegleria gruberi TaxID=5762 RepID=D2UZS6_NAEGR|nr:uncharacterized protein NAEGRDRAFT_77961 [Naegleria gruberi]EFC50214.1 predicted protein [Naegleria gruberi]|eukprot:XP_002682958.1 predicted protein [Naegleria gruberi strain NEG-M]